ncbi:MAG: hypothetical protein N2115_03370 [bacterium]|nr:hypothetical protein [bacterium]
MGEIKELVSVAFDIPEKKLFTYQTKIPVEPGQRVKVSFGKRKVVGWVVGPGIPGNYNYKEIIKVYDKKPLINEFLFKLATEMAAEYFTSIGNVLGIMSKNLALTKKEKIFERKQVKVSGFSDYAEKSFAMDVLEDMKSKKTMIGIVKFPSTEKKKKFFQSLPGVCKGSCLIVFSNFIDVKRYSESLQLLYGDSLIVLTGEMRKKEKRAIWERMIEEKNLVITGTRICLFSPVSDLSIVVVDEPSEYGHKENNQPRYNSKEIALMISKILGIPVIFTVFQPDVTDIYYTKKSNAILIDYCQDLQLPKVIISQMHWKSQDDLLTETSKHLLEKTIIEKRKVVLIHNVKGYARLVSCKKCGSTVMCQECGDTVVPVSDRYVYCAKCKRFAEIPVKCTNCRKGSLSARFPGIQKIMQNLKSLYPFFSAGLISDTGKTDFNCDILVGTQHAVQYLEQISPGLLIFINADTIAARNTFRSEEKFFLLAEKIKKIMQGQDNIIIIQTRNSGMDVYLDVSRDNSENFYKRELSIREKLMFPPFGEFIELGFSGRKWHKNRNTIFDELRQYGEIYEISSGETENRIWWKVSDREKAFELLKSIVEKYRIQKISLDTTPYF